MKEIFTYMFKTRYNMKMFFVFYALIALTIFNINFTGMFSPIATLGDISPIFYILICISIATLFLPFGYGNLTLSSLLKSDENFSFPELNFKNIYIAGFKTIAAFALFLLIPFIVLIIMGFLNSYFIANKITAASFLICVFSILFLIISAFFIPEVACKFAKEGDFFSFLKFKSIIKDINSNTAGYFINFLILLGSSLILFILREFLLNHLMPYGFIGLIVYTLFFPLAITYLLLVILKLCAKSTNY